MKKLKTFEPSSALYLGDLNRYVLSSDDTDKNETPYLFLMDDRGQVDETPLRVQNLSQMTDIESMTQDGQGNMYLLSSLSINKNGANKFSRNLFSKVSRQGKDLVLLEKVELRSLLLHAIKNSDIPDIQAIQNQVDQSLDIESHFIFDGQLYLGLKNPQPRPNEALILNLGRIEVLLKEQRIEELSVWKTVNFGGAGTECLLSDLQMSGDEIYLSTTSDRGEPGYLWHLQISTDTLSRVDTFDDVKPEGLALRAKDNKLMIVFDQGLEPALFHMRPRL
ncbi:hypothetical protein [Bdellovibrio bacteriovorus]|nr:hypothetical protein [Bdellovibrio bacteriovorus]